MSRFSAPPGRASRVRAARALVVAPHFDDEVVGCGGLLRQLVTSGADVRVLFLSDGSGGVEAPDDPRAYAASRQQEAARVARRLGLASFSELGLEDGALMDRVPEVARAIGGAMMDFNPGLVLAPAPTEITTDHRAAFLALHRALSGLRSGDTLFDVAAATRYLLYEVNRPLHPDLLVDVGAEMDEILSLMELYATQTARHGYGRAIAGLRRYRTLTLAPDVEAAEAYRTLQLEDFTTRSAEALVRHLGGITDSAGPFDGPPVSVIVRTRDRPRRLREALESVAAGIYRSVEVVLVNDGGQRPELPPDFPFSAVLRVLDDSRGPAAAAQAGLDAASGERICFLDDDDLLFPEHLARLVDLAAESGSPVVYSDAAAGEYVRDPAGSWQCRQRRLPYSRDFDEPLLLLDNYIPFHTVLMERQLAMDVGGLDDTLAFFEDWDLLIRLSERTAFRHLEAVTCEYRHFRGDSSHVLGSDPVERRDFAAMRARLYEKHAHRLGPETLAAAITTLRQEGSDLAERHRGALADLARPRGEAGGG